MLAGLHTVPQRLTRTGTEVPVDFGIEVLNQGTEQRVDFPEYKPLCLPDRLLEQSRPNRDVRASRGKYALRPTWRGQWPVAGPMTAPRRP